MILKSLWIWACIIPLAILNGIIRESFLVPLIGQNYALPVSGISLCILIFGLCWACIPSLGRATSYTYTIIGIVWALLTISFEFLFGTLLANKPFAELLQAYDITTGNLWSIIVIFVGVLPWLIAKIKQLIWN